MLRALTFSAVLLIASACAWAQGMQPGFVGGTPVGGGFGAGFGVSSGRIAMAQHGHNGRGFVVTSRHHPHSRFFDPARQGIFFGDGFLDGAYWEDEPVVVNEQAEPVAVETRPRTSEKSEPKPADPVMIEWQNNHFVRLNDAQANAASASTIPSDYSEQATKKPRTRTNSSAAVADSTKFSPTILVFRDGRRSEVDSYAIIGRTLYESSADQSAGYTSGKIELADLNIPETIKLNQSRGIRFVLPSAPNEVVTRP